MGRLATHRGEGKAVTIKFLDDDLRRQRTPTFDSGPIRSHLTLVALREGRNAEAEDCRRDAPEWDVYRLQSSPAAFIGVVYAHDKADAIAIKEHKIRLADQKLLLATPR